MPTREQILNNKLQAFNTKYSLQLTSEALNIRLGDSTGDALKNNYKELLTQSLLDYLSHAMQMRRNASYDFTEFSIPEFTQEFEDLMQAKCDVQNIGSRPAYEGGKLEELFDFMKEQATPYSYRLPQLWEKDFKEGRLTVESMREVTTESANILLGEGADKPDNMRQVSKDALRTLVAAQLTMTAVREKRGFFYPLFHPILNYREKNYLKELNEKVELCKQNKFNVPICKV